MATPFFFKSTSKFAIYVGVMLMCNSTAFSATPETNLRIIAGKVYAKHPIPKATMPVQTVQVSTTTPKTETEKLVEKARAEFEEKNYGEAERLFNIAIAHDDLFSIVFLANEYLQGGGLPANYKKAVFLYRKAVDAKHPKAIL